MEGHFESCGHELSWTGEIDSEKEELEDVIMSVTI